MHAYVSQVFLLLFLPEEMKKKNVVELDVDGNLRDFLGYSLGALFDTYVLLQRAKLDACG